MVLKYRRLALRMVLKYRRLALRMVLFLGYTPIRRPREALFRLVWVGTIFFLAAIRQCNLTRRSRY